MSLQIEEVSFSYGKHLALNDISASLENGVYGLLGANGAGKTTLISVLVKILSPQRGRVLFDRKDIRELGQFYFDNVGYLPQSPRFYSNYTIEEFLLYMATLKGMRKNEARERSSTLLEFVNLVEERKKKIGACSGGMRQRVGIAQAMLNDPAILILDEPTAGLDPLERIRFRNLISRLGDNRTVLLATHIVSDVEHIARNILLLKNGQIIKQGTPLELSTAVDNCVWEVVVDNEKQLMHHIREFKVSNIKQQESQYIIRIVHANKPTAKAHLVPPTLEDAYLWHFGEDCHVSAI